MSRDLYLKTGSRSNTGQCHHHVASTVTQTALSFPSDINTLNNRDDTATSRSKNLAEQKIKVPIKALQMGKNYLSASCASPV